MNGQNGRNPVDSQCGKAMQVGQLELPTIPPNVIPPAHTSITPQILRLVELDEDKIEHVAQALSGGAENIQDLYPLTPMQEKILSHQLGGRRGAGRTLSPRCWSSNLVLCWTPLLKRCSG